MKLIGRKQEISYITKRIAREPENLAFFGVKGIGKSTLFGSIFTKVNCKKYAAKYHNLFVRTILQPTLKGEDLSNFLLDRVRSGIKLIEDEAIRDDLQRLINDSAEEFISRESSLHEVLETIRDYEYSFILIMDDFQNMGRNSSIGTDQYDFLRSLSELGLIYYWIVSDSDFSDVYATEQFTTSFFAQKFNGKTISQMAEADSTELINITANNYDVELSDATAKAIYEITGGIPGFVEPAVKYFADGLTGTFDSEFLIQHLLGDIKCISLLTSWSRSLTEKQKNLLQRVAEREQVLEAEFQQCGTIGAVNALGDNSGLGLLVKKNNEDDSFWTTNSLLFSRFILDKANDFYDAAITPPREEVIVEPAQSPVVQYINNYITVNNVFSPENAVRALAGLKEYIHSGLPSAVPPDRLLGEVVQQLPFQQEEWALLEDSQKDDKLDEYAESVFESEEFQFDTLSDNQMARFFLTPDILSHLSEANRRNLISAIGVYDMLQFCIDKFGLDFQYSESARGILFAKVYEAILKDNLRAALKSVPRSANFQLRAKNNQVPFWRYYVDQLTFGSFTTILDDVDVQSDLGGICVNQIGTPEFDAQWWGAHSVAIRKISALRNLCCHAGDKFDAVKMSELLKYLFEDSAISHVVLYDAIANR